MELKVTEADKTRLESLEKIVEHGRKKQREGYAALKEIRDRELYKAAGYSSFESYCKEVWQISKSRVYQLIDFVEMTSRLAHDIDVSDLHEGCVRPLIGMDDESAAEVIEKARGMASEEGKQAVTASLMKKAVKEIAPQPPEPKRSTRVDSSEASPSNDPVSGDKAKQCARRALEALASSRKMQVSLDCLDLSSTGCSISLKTDWSRHETNSLAASIQDTPRLPSNVGEEVTAVVCCRSQSSI